MAMPTHSDAKLPLPDPIEERLKEIMALGAKAAWDLARHYSKAGRQQEALALVQSFLCAATDPEERARLLLALGQLNEQLGQYEAALGFYRHALAHEPNAAEVWYYIHNNLAFCLNHFGRFADAEPFLRKALRIVPELPNAYKNLGISLTGLGRYEEAARVYIEGAKICPFDERSSRLLAKLLQDHPKLKSRIPEASEWAKEGP